MDENQALSQLKKRFRSQVPSGSDITKLAMRDVLGSHADEKGWIKDNFSALIEDIQRAAYRKYLDAERPAAASAFRKVLGPMLSASPTKDEYFELLERNFWCLDRFFLGLTQGRRPRAGKAFEHVVKVLFDKLGYPYTPQPIINGQPDFLLPSVEHWEQNAMDCIIFTVKRSLRERWRQIISEGTRGHQFFLATIDEKIAKRDLPEMLANRIYLVMPEPIAAAKYPSATNVISFEKFFDQHLDPAMHRWRTNDVIPQLDDDPSLA